MPDTSQHKGNARESVIGSWPGVFWLFLLSLVLYIATANRGPQWQDSGDYIWRIVQGQLLSPLGLALSHPLHHWLGRGVTSFVPLEPSFAITLVSASAAAVAVACVYGCVVTLTANRVAALFAAISLALANTFWHLATITEVYTLSAALLAGECWCLVKYAREHRRVFLWGMLLLNGIGLANHLSAVLTMPVLAVVAVWAVRQRHVTPKDVAMGIGFWVIGALPYLCLVGQELMRSGDFWGTVGSALFGKSTHSYAGHVLNVSLSGKLLGASLVFVVYNFPNLLLPAAFYGMAQGRRVGVSALAKWALLAGFIIHSVFVLRYSVIDRHTFFLPMYVFLVLFGGIGAATVLQWPRSTWRRIVIGTGVCLLVVTPAFYAVGTAAARELGVLGSYVRNKPYRDDYAYLLLPWASAERSAERMSAEAVRLAGSSGLIVVEDPMAISAIRYKVWRTGLAGLDVISASQSDSIRRAAVANRPVVLVPRKAELVGIPAPMGSWRHRGDLYVLDVAKTSRTTRPTATDSMVAP